MEVVSRLSDRITDARVLAAARAYVDVILEYQYLKSLKSGPNLESAESWNAATWADHTARQHQCNKDLGAAERLLVQVVTTKGTP